MTRELQRLSDALVGIVRRSLVITTDTRSLDREIGYLSRHLGAVGDSRPPRDRVREAVAEFRATRQLRSAWLAKMVCHGLTESFPESPRPLIEDDKWFLHTLAGVDDFHAEPRAFRRCYRGLLRCYFAYDVDLHAPESPGAVSHRRLRNYLRERLGSVRVEGTQCRWVDVISEHRNLLTEDPVSRYGAALLREESSEFDEVCAALEIGDASWIMRRLVLAQVQAAAARPDREFEGYVNPLLKALWRNELLKNEGLALLLERFRRTEHVREHVGLRDASIEAWGNPSLESNAAKWGRVSAPTRLMVRDWLNLDLIRHFFSLLAEDRNTDKRRIQFWEKYYKQIDQIYVALGPRSSRDRSKDMKGLREKLGSRLLTLTHQGAAANNAFIMCMGDRVIVEFGMTGNACFVFKRDRVPFRLSGSVAGDGSGLKYEVHEHRLLHVDRSYETWEQQFEATLRGLGIGRGTAPPMPTQTGIDRPAALDRSPPVASIRATVGKPREASKQYSRQLLRTLVDAHGLQVKDMTQVGGRLWVFKAPKTGAIADQLTAWDFRWANAKNGWYRDKRD